MSTIDTTELIRRISALDKSYLLWDDFYNFGPFFEGRPDLGRQFISELVIMYEKGEVPSVAQVKQMTIDLVGLQHFETVQSDTIKSIHRRGLGYTLN